MLGRLWAFMFISRIFPDRRQTLANAHVLGFFPFFLFIMLSATIIRVHCARRALHSVYSFIHTLQLRAFTFISDCIPWKSACKLWYVMNYYIVQWFISYFFSCIPRCFLAFSRMRKFSYKEKIVNANKILYKRGLLYLKPQNNAGKCGNEFSFASN